MSAASVDTHPVVVFRSSDPARADLVRATLEEAGMECLLDNEQQGSLAGVDLIPVELVVKACDANQARSLVAGHEQVNDF
ncbi:hypothetical protein GC176_07595 [bacterium]|nr:hypothetical protein [bacterium]